MFKTVEEDVWVIDAEWVPDPVTGRRLYGLSDDTPDADVVARMFQAAGATEDDPRPFVKTALCRVVSISVVKRKATGQHPVQLELKSIPAAGDAPLPEAQILEPFLEAVGKVKPQFVGFFIHGADIPILVQRALATGISVPEFFKRPNKPWEGVDYFGRGSDAAVDLMDVFGVRARGNPSLNELAAVAGVPGKLDTAGEQVVDLWQEEEIRGDRALQRVRLAHHLHDLAESGAHGRFHRPAAVRRRRASARIAAARAHRRG